MTQAMKRLVARAPGISAARLGQAASNGAAVLAMGAVVIATIAISPLRDSAIWVYLAAIIGFVLAGAAIVAGISYLAELYGQHARDLSAQELLAALQRGQSVQPFTLYLRPFSSTDVFSESVLVTQQVGVGARGVFFGATERLELEAQIESATRKVGRLVALGEPLEHIGAGRIRVTEDTWKDAVAALAPQAELIILLPSSRAGTHWEIDRLLSNPDLMARTVVVDPPNPVAAKNWEFDQAEEWNDVRKAFASHGYDLPDDDKAGSLLFYGGSRAPILKTPLEVDADDEIARFFRRVVRNRSQAG